MIIARKAVKLIPRTEIQSELLTNTDDESDYGTSRTQHEIPAPSFKFSRSLVLVSRYKFSAALCCYSLVAWLSRLTLRSTFSLEPDNFMTPFVVWAQYSCKVLSSIFQNELMHLRILVAKRACRAVLAHAL